MFNLSIVVPTHNRLENLKAVLAGLEAQSYPLSQFEVIVVSDGSTDGTQAYLSNLSTSLNLVALFQENKGVAAARNRGVQAAQGALILFLDDDVFPTPALVQEHVRSHQELGSQAVVIGPMLAPPDFHPPAWVQWEHQQLVKQYLSMELGEWTPTARQFYTGNTSLARAQILTVGGFDSSFKRAEDVELAYRLAEAGMQFHFNPRAIGYHYANRSYTAWKAIPFAYGINDVRFAQEKGQRWLLPTLWTEYHQRHHWVQGLVWLCMDKPFLTGFVLAIFAASIYVGDKFHLNKITMLACSSIFNLRYYQGVAAQLGGREAFFTGVKNTIPAGYVPAETRHSVQEERL